VAPGMGDIDRDPIIYGGSAPDADYHDAVVALHWVRRGLVSVQPFCTGTLVSDDVVVTAAHCMDVASTWSHSYRTMSTRNLAVYIGDDPSVDLASHVYPVTDIQIYSSYDRRLIRNDIALVRLATPFTESVTPVQPLPSSEGFDSTDVGETLNFAGFGVTEAGSSGVKLQADGVLAGTGCAVSSCRGSSDTATQISYAQDSGTGPCYGDSGGPAFVARSGTTYLGGVTSYGDADCTLYGVSTRVDAFETFISDFVGPTDTGTVDTGTVDTGTVDTGTTAFCGDDVCGSGESCDGFASGTTACSADCAGMLTGPRRFRYCTVEGTCYGPGCL